MIRIEQFINHLSTLDLAVFWVNLFLLLFSRWIVQIFRKPTDASFDIKLWALRTINVTLLGLEVIALFEHQYARHISLTGVTLLLTFLLVHFFQLFLLLKLGRVKEIEGEQYRVETYQSEIFSLFGVLLASIAAILIIINIWEMTDWLQATSVLGGLLLLLFSTKDVWAPDNINGLILLYNADVEPGSVVKVDEFDLLAIAMKTTLAQTVFLDLRGRHRIILPNSKLRSVKIEVLTRCPASGLKQFVDFNIAYGFSSERIEAFLTQVWEGACALEPSINNEKPVAIGLLANGDHAVTWRLTYSLKNIYKLISAQFAINRAAYDLSLQQNIGLNTPLTHEITQQNPVNQ